jgi:hypothetical protein
VLYLLLFASPTTALRPATTINPCILYSDSAKHLKQFAEDVWSPDRWRRGDPPAKTIDAWRLKLHCAPPNWQKRLKQRWRELQGEYFDRRRAELWRRRVTPFCSSGTCYALPVPLVICESGGNYGFTYGAYSILDPAWSAWGGETAHAGEASKREQDFVAHRGYSRYGESPWECKGDGAPHPF